jgi:hypothetical protein
MTDNIVNLDDHRRRWKPSNTPKLPEKIGTLPAADTLAL